jgi:hypothetical protein
MIIIVFLGVLGSILLLIPSALIISALGVAFGNFLVDFMFLLGFTYYSEVSTKKSRTLANVLMFLSIVFGSFICLIIASFTSSFWVIDVVVLVLLIPLLILSFAMRESIYYLYNNKAKKQFFNTLTLMAEINEVNLKTVIRDINPRMKDSEDLGKHFIAKNKFQSNMRYSYRDFSMDFNEFSMKENQYRRDHFESYSKEQNASDSNSMHNPHSNMFNYSINKNLNNSSRNNSIRNNGSQITHRLAKYEKIEF